MKEKIKKFFKGVTPYLVLAWFNLAAFAYHIVLSIKHSMWEITMIGVPFLLVALLAFDLHQKEKKIKYICGLKELIRAIAGDFAYELKRYKERYGDLPPEEEPKPEESKKQNSENP